MTRRSILLRSVFELWAEGTSYEELHGNLKAKLAADPSLLEPYMESRFRFQISAFGASLTLQEQRERVESFSFMACRGPIDLKTPEVIYVLAEDYGRDPKRSSPPETFRRAYFGLLIGSGNRDARTKFDLKKRAYLGTTSMDAELSLIMSNTAKVTPGSVVLDPFVGTGSMLVTAAHFGGLVVGCDIDGRQIRGGRIGIPFKHTAGKDIRDNVQQYNCQKQLIDTPVCDISHHPWRPVGFFDAIITDVSYCTPSMSFWSY